MADRKREHTISREMIDTDTPAPMHNQCVNRRAVIRKMAAGTAVLAGCSVLPDKWVSPLIEFGSLPAHATTSGAVEAIVAELRQGISETESAAATSVQAAPASAEATPVEDMRGYANKITVNNNGAKISIDQILRDKFVFPKLGPQYGPKLLVVWSDGRELSVPDSKNMTMYGGNDERKYQPGGPYSGNNPDIPSMEVYAAIGTHPMSVTVYY